jgi:dipeptidase E
MPSPTTADRRRIVAIGGGGFSDGEDPELDDFILSLTGKDEPRVCFLGQASGDDPGYFARFVDAFAGRAKPTRLKLFNRDVVDLERFLLDQDLVYVGGGNTANLLAVWHLHGLDRALRAAWEAGVVLAGLSAGSICWFEAGTTDSFGKDLQPLTNGLGFLPGSHCPHYDGEATRRPAYHHLVGEGLLPDGWAVDDGAAIHFVGTDVREVVTAREGATAYRVERSGDGVTETRMDARLLAVDVDSGHRSGKST